MSQETPIGNLSGGISEEDAKLVDSILNDLGQGQQAPQQMQPQQMQPQQMQPQQMTQEQQALLAQQQALQQQAMQQQAMQQQALQQQAMQQQAGPQVAGSADVSMVDSIKRESKSIMVIIVLSILFNLGQVDNLFKKIYLFVGEDGALNLQCVFVKALLIGMLFFFIKKQIS